MPRDKYWGDVIYETWRSGGNPDLVSDDCVEECRAEYFYPDECAEQEVRRQRRIREVDDA